MNKRKENRYQQYKNIAEIIDESKIEPLDENTAIFLGKYEYAFIREEVVINKDIKAVKLYLPGKEKKSVPYNESFLVIDSKAQKIPNNEYFTIHTQVMKNVTFKQDRAYELERHSKVLEQYLKK